MIHQLLRGRCKSDPQTKDFRKSFALRGCPKHLSGYVELPWTCSHGHWVGEDGVLQPPTKSCLLWWSVKKSFDLSDVEGFYCRIDMVSLWFVPSYFCIFDMERAIHSRHGWKLYQNKQKTTFSTVFPQTLCCCQALPGNRTISNCHCWAAM